MKIKDIIIAIFISLIWGGNYVAMKLTTVEVPGFLSAAIRLFLTALVLFPFISKIDIKVKRLYPISLVVGAYIGLVYYAMHLGINLYLGIILKQFNAVFAILIANIVLKEPFTIEGVLGMIVAFIGMVIVVGTPDAIGNSFAALVVLVATVFCAIFSVKSKVLKNIPSITLIFWTSLIASPHLFLLSYFLEGSPLKFIQDTDYTFWLYLSYSIFVSCILGISLRIYLLRKYPVYKVVPFNLLIPFFGFSFSAIVGESMPSWYVLSGGMIIVFGIAITQVRLKELFKKIIV